MKKILYVNGCSHSCGAEISYKNSHRTQYDLDNCFGGVIAKRFNLIHYNDALSGASNKYIVSNTIRSILELLKEYQANEIFVIIAWTGMERIPFIFEDQLYNFTASVPDEILENWPNQVQINYRNWVSISNINESSNSFSLDYFILRNFFLQVGIDYCFFNAIHLPRFPEKNTLHMLKNNVSDHNLFEIMKNDKRYLGVDKHEMSYTSYLKKRYDPFEGGRNYHFREAAHAEWAKLLISQIGKHRLRSK